MPMLLYLCRACGYQFQKLVGDPSPQEVACKSSKCSGKAWVRPSSGARITTSTMPSGPVPQNTGLSHMDHDVDRVIARDSEWRIQEMMGRQREKMAFMEREKVDGHHLSRLSDGDYFVISEEERRAAKKARVLVQTALDQKPADLTTAWPEEFKVRWSK